MPGVFGTCSVPGIHRYMSRIGTFTPIGDLLGHVVGDRLGLAVGFDVMGDLLGLAVGFDNVKDYLGLAVGLTVPESAAAVLTVRMNGSWILCGFGYCSFCYFHSPN